MCEFKPGDEVVCVDAGPVRPGEIQALGHGDSVPAIAGQIYTVKGFGVWPGDWVTPVVYLVEIKNDDRGDDMGFLPRRFRKVQRRDLSAWLNTATKFEEPKRKKANA